MPTPTTEGPQAIAIEVINNLPSVSVRKIEGKKPVYITVESVGMRADAREMVFAALQKRKLVVKEKLFGNKSSEAGTAINGGVNIIYKSAKGGMSETTLNASITELFPLIAFKNNISGALTEHKFYNEIQKAFNKNDKLFVGSDGKAGETFVIQAAESTKFKNKINAAKGVLDYVQRQNAGKKIKNVWWGYRAKPPGVSANHAGDIFIEYEDGEKIGISIKAGGKKTQEPKLNTYVRKTIFTAFNDPTTYNDWMKESYQKFYTKVPNILPSDQYGTPQMVSVVAALEAEDPVYYNELYDEQLDWLRTKMIDYLNTNCNKTKKWLLEYVAHEDKNVPTVILKAFENKVGWEVQNDDDIVKECVKRSKPCSQKGVWASKGSGKQDINIALTCKTHPTILNFSIRTNKSGINHKLGQFINLAFKFNGVSK
tara:strand:- start:70 stop:1350 length:1281 start_codon:yes stop_codon:yes gene_type:complete